MKGVVQLWCTAGWHDGLIRWGGTWGGTRVVQWNGTMPYLEQRGLLDGAVVLHQRRHVPHPDPSNQARVGVGVTAD